MKLYATFIKILSLFLTLIGGVLLGALWLGGLLISVPLILVGWVLFSWSDGRLIRDARRS